MVGAPFFCLQAASARDLSEGPAPSGNHDDLRRSVLGGPVPMPQAHPNEPGPVPMPQVQPNEFGRLVTPKPEKP